jgi:hypothetical protein
MNTRMPPCWVGAKDGVIKGTHDAPCNLDGVEGVRYVPAQPYANPAFAAFANDPPRQQAQPEQVNAMLLEALEAAEKLEHAALVALSEATYELKVGNTYTTATDTYKANNELIHRLDKILNLQYRDRKREARLAARQAQPERAPLTNIEAHALLRRVGILANFETITEIIRAVEKHHGIKQGGQQ